jgi:hypothetical protein
MATRSLVAVACLVHAVVICFLIVPIKALGFPAIGVSPAVWVILDPLILWHGLPCALKAIIGSCSNTALNLSGVFISVTTRACICVCALISGCWAFEWLSNRHKGS